MLTYDNLDLKFTAKEEWKYETAQKPRIEVEHDYETGSIYVSKRFDTSPTKKDYDLIRTRAVKIDATFLDVEISSLTMLTFVHGHIESWLYRKLGEYKDELSGRGGKTLGGYIFFKRTQKQGREYLYVTVENDNTVVRERYFNYPEVAQLKQAINKLLACVRI